MRYRDKGTPKKDLMKAKWYIDDFRKHFIDYNNDSMFIHKVSEDVIEKMCKITECEPREEIKHMFEQLMIIVTQNHIIDMKEFDTVLYDFERLIETV